MGNFTKSKVPQKFKIKSYNYFLFLFPGIPLQGQEFLHSLCFGQLSHLPRTSGWLQLTHLTVIAARSPFNSYTDTEKLAPKTTSNAVNAIRDILFSMPSSQAKKANLKNYVQNLLFSNGRRIKGL